MVKARSDAIGVLCGSLVSLVFVVLAGAGYKNLPMPDPLGFLVFVAASLSVALSLAFTAGAWLATRIFSSARRRMGMATGVAAAGLILWPWWVFHVLGRQSRPIELAAIGVSALALASLLWVFSYWLSARGPSRGRFGWVGIVLLALLAWGLHATRAGEYVPPAPLRSAAGALPLSPLASKPTNLLLITVDTLRADHLSLYGYGRRTSPALEALAERSVVFESAISQRTFTAPSIATILTGTYPPTHKTLDNRSHLRASNVTLAETLSEMGFKTVAAAGNPGLGRAFRFDQGFESFQTVAIKGEAEVYGLDPREADLLGELALPLLEEVRGDRFFAWLHFMDPHTPYIVPEDYREIYLDDPLSDANKGAQTPAHSNYYKPIEDSSPFYRNRGVDFAISQYDAEIKFLDDYLGRLFAYLDELGLSSNTLVILTADHGENMGEHRGVYFGHFHPYQHTIRVPLVIAHPDLPSGLRIDRKVSLVDIVPTVLSLLGLPQNPEIQGQSLARLILEGDERGLRPYHYSTGTGRLAYATQSVQTDTHKLIVDFRREGFAIDAIFEGLGKLWVPPDFFNPYHYRREKFELYDLAQDPDELVNLAGQDPQRQAELEEALWTWLDASHYEARERKTEAAEIDPGIEEALQALGYVE
ncbi:MAG: sulfatase-like hydrolase/transferase [Myxococcota bacterium]|nr:sulfatase-like hydrolase/transferase [Myxococcota bacterium]